MNKVIVTKGVQGPSGPPGPVNSVVGRQGAVTAAQIAAALGLTNPMPVLPPASTGLDFSANQPTLPAVGAVFSTTGPYANYVLIATVPASPTRANVDVENISGGQIVVVRDDGTAVSGAAPNNASLFVLGGGTAAGAQGGSWSSTTFKGRLQIYAPSSSAIVAVMED